MADDALTVAQQAMLDLVREGRVTDKGGEWRIDRNLARAGQTAVLNRLLRADLITFTADGSVVVASDAPAAPPATEGDGPPWVTPNQALVEARNVARRRGAGPFTPEDLDAAINAAYAAGLASAASPGGAALPPVPYDQHERKVLAEVDNRDHAAEWADRLAYAVAPVEVIGEHTSANSPWANALAILQERGASPGGEGGRWPTGAELIAAERRRQVEVEGWTPDHDAQHDCETLYLAGYCYANQPGKVGAPPERWPWDAKWWKPKERLRNLVRAGALYQAAYDLALSGRVGVLSASAASAPAMLHGAINGIAHAIDALLAEVQSVVPPVAPAGPGGGLDREALGAACIAVMEKRGVSGHDAVLIVLDLFTGNGPLAALAPLLTGGGG